MSVAKATLPDAYARWQRGDAAGAELAVRGLLAADAADSGALTLLAAIVASGGRRREAYELLIRAALLEPSNPRIPYNLGTLALELDDTGAATGHFERALLLDPSRIEAGVNLGHAHLRAGAVALARAAFERVLARRPDDPMALYGLARACAAANDSVRAAATYRALCSLQPQFIDAWTGLVEVLATARQHAEVAAAAREALRVHARSAVLNLALGNAEMALRRPASAVTHYDAACAIEPAFVSAWINLGEARRELGDLDGAALALAHALKITPDSAAAHYSLGLVHGDAGRPDIAVGYLERAAALEPGNARTRHQLGESLREAGRIDEALEQGLRAHREDPHQPLYAAGALLTASQACRFATVDSLWPSVLGGLRAGVPIAAGIAFALCTDPADLRVGAVARAGSVAGADGTGASPPRPRSTATANRVRVAYLSPDFGEHPVGQSLVAVLEQHDPDRFEITGVSLASHPESPVRARIARACSAFIDASAWPQTRIVEALLANGCDIAVDLAGYTRGARPGVFAQRPAPIQVSYLGHPGTLGAPWIDYLLTDDYVVPERLAGDYSEQIVRLPGSFFPGDPLPIERLPPAGARAAHGLPDDAFVACAFNIPARITVAMARTWFDILADVAGSVLWLRDPGRLAAESLAALAHARGIDPSRLVYAQRVPGRDAHLARHRLADLYLDTSPYNGHSTVRDALFVGLPVLTLSGETYPSRVAGSLLTTLGLSELITHTPDGYRRRATELARDRGRLAALRARLEAALPASPLADPRGLTRAIERAYLTMIARRDAGLAPAPFSVPATG